ncbi:energy transducer TonB [Novosphingobium sp. ERN07]|uniref:energy transducer TonB family protein n=1 Tax=Novosphingobium sp. ERN07 TaxID=2726187 RepID=UPI0014571D7D|nr:energy transducer TonB [Novosphingobium sp. ERN07]NLR72065.1 energy transducer TonB [Novosphingobium sp. ERN07]
MILGFGHRELSDGTRFATRAGPASTGARITALLATITLHILVFAGLMHLTITKQGSDQKPVHHLTVISLPPPRSEPPSPRKAQVAAPILTKASVQQLAAPSNTLSAPLPPTATSAPVKPAEAAVELTQPPAAASHVEAADDVLRDYQAIIWRHIAAHKPRGVQTRGTVTVRFQLDRDGAVLALDIVRSSGNFNLDRIALRVIRQSGAFPAPPSGLASSQLHFTVPIDFR